MIVYESSRQRGHRRFFEEILPQILKETGLDEVIEEREKENERNRSKERKV